MTPSISVIIVSFNTKDVLRECLTAFLEHTKNLTTEIIVIDNASKDSSPQMVRSEFPSVQLIESAVNLGFAGANDLGFRLAKGRYFVILNSDAFLHPGSLQKAFKYMENEPLIGLGGGRLVGRDNSWQPSARMFPSLFNDFLHLSGLATKYPHSRLFGRADGTWDDPDNSRECDWVPGAFAIIRREALEKVNYFDERFFLYYEEVDLCKRIKQQGYSVWYWGDVVVTHLGGESSKTIQHLSLSKTGSQLTLWRMRSQLLYYRKNSGRLTAWLCAQMERKWNYLRAWKNKDSVSAEKQAKRQDALLTAKLMEQAWEDTKGGVISPPQPW